MLRLLVRFISGAPHGARAHLGLSPAALKLEAYPEEISSDSLATTRDGEQDCGAAAGRLRSRGGRHRHTVGRPKPKPCAVRQRAARATGLPSSAESRTVAACLDTHM